MRIALLVLVIAAALAVAASAVVQASPNAGAPVNGGSFYCSPDGSTIRFEHSGPLPTRHCGYPPDLP
jgi:hypothetical protein